MPIIDSARLTCTRHKKTKRRNNFRFTSRLRAQHLADLDKQIADIRQFVYSEKDQTPAKP